MASVNDLASKKAYIVGQLAAGGGSEGMMKWWREFKQVNKELEDALAQAEASKSQGHQSPEPTTSTEEAIKPAAPNDSDKDDLGCDSSIQASTSEEQCAKTTAKSPKTSRRKVAFKEPEPSECSSCDESSNHSSPGPPSDHSSPGDIQSPSSPSESEHSRNPGEISGSSSTHSNPDEDQSSGSPGKTERDRSSDESKSSAQRISDRVTLAKMEVAR